MGTGISTEQITSSPKQLNNRQILTLSFFVATFVGAAFILIYKPAMIVEEVHTFTTSNHPVLGSLDKGAEVVMFMDYNCPACKSFEKQIPEFKRRIIDQGLAHISLYQSPFISESSKDMSRAAICAYEDSNASFWRYHELLMQRKAVESSKTDWSELTELAKKANLNIQNWKTCLKSGLLDMKIKDDLDVHKEVGMLGTPAVFVNGVRVPAGTKNIVREIIRQQKEKKVVN